MWYSSQDNFTDDLFARPPVHMKWDINFCLALTKKLKTNKKFGKLWLFDSIQRENFYEY